MRRPPLALLLAIALSAGACSTAYYAAMSQLGWAKADLLANRAQQARDAMNQARILFTEARTQFAEAATETGGDRAARHEALRATYGDAQASGSTIAKRRAAMEKAADALFGEWRLEIADAKDDAQRAKRQQRYDSFRPPYDRLLDAMRAAEASMPPVLDAMQATLTALQAANAGTSVPALPAATTERLIRDLQLAVALADQYVVELENAD